MGNIALGKTATANAYVMPFAPSRAVDGSLDPTSRWVSGNNGSTPWLMVDLGAQSYINRYVVKSMGSAGWTDTRNNNQAFTVYVYSGNANGTPVDAVTDSTGWTPVDTVTANSLSVVDRTLNTAVFCRYVTIAFTVGLTINPKLASVVEFEVYSTPCSNLLSLALSSGTLTPTFNGTTVFNYTATVSMGTASIQVLPIAIDSTATIKVNGVAVISGAVSQPIPLNYGANTVTVAVTTTAGQTTTYTVTVTRLGPALSNLVLSDGTLTPTYNANTFNYTATVGYNSSSITVTPTAVDPAATITVNGTTVTSGSASGPITVNFGNSNTISVVVTDGGQTQTYTVTVLRPSPYLTSLQVKRGMGYITWTPTFDTKQNLNYAVTLSGVSVVKFLPISEDAQASITINGIAVSSGGSCDVPLTVSANSIVLVVTACDNTTKMSYNFTITRTS